MLFCFSALHTLAEMSGDSTKLGRPVYYLIFYTMSFQVDTFLMMYKIHCQGILDTTINGNFEDVSTKFCS